MTGGSVAARVYSRRRTTGDQLRIDAAICSAIGAHRPRHRRAIAVIEAGADGVRVRPVLDRAKLACTAVAAAAVVWLATRRDP
jgi:hypothetical protein